MTYEESSEIFRPLPRDFLKEQLKVSLPARQGGVVATSQSGANIDFLAEVLQAAQIAGWDMEEQFLFHQKMLYLANAACSAVGVEVGDYKALNRVLEQLQALISLGLEYVSFSDVNHGLAVIQAKHPKLLFQMGLSLIHDLRKDMAHLLKSLPSSQQLARLLQTGSFGLILEFIDENWSETLGLEEAESLKGLFNRFPMMLVRVENKLHFEPVRSISAFRLMQTTCIV